MRTKFLKKLIVLGLHALKKNSVAFLLSRFCFFDVDGSVKVYE